MCLSILVKANTVPFGRGTFGFYRMFPGQFASQVKWLVDNILYGNMGAVNRLFGICTAAQVRTWLHRSQKRSRDNAYPGCR